MGRNIVVFLYRVGSLILDSLPDTLDQALLASLSIQDIGAMWQVDQAVKKTDIGVIRADVPSCTWGVVSIWPTKLTTDHLDQEHPVRFLFDVYGPK